MSTDKTLADVQPGGRVQLMPSDAARALLAAQYRDDGDKAKAIRINHKSLTDADKRALRAIEAALAARQPVGEPVAWVNGRHLDECIAMPMIENNDDATVLNPRNIAASSRPDGYTDTPLYRHPAQAVDLGQFREMAKFVEEFVLGVGCAPQSSRIYDQSLRLLALIDSKDRPHG